jgi:hypothetical protein
LECAILRIKGSGLVGHGNELRVVVKRKALNLGAKTPVSFGEEHGAHAIPGQSSLRELLQNR